MNKTKTASLQIIEGYPLPVEIKRHARARHISLRLHSTKGRIVITLPLRGSIRASLQFLDAKKEWVLAQIDKLAPTNVLADGCIITVLGNPIRVIHAPGKRGMAWIKEDKLYVTGDAEFLTRRVRDFLKSHAKKILSEMARSAALKIDKSILRIDIRDMHSRWGSCASDGRLCFSWRLILAPKEVCEYVVAHEVAHLAHLNHSAAFWKVVDSLHEDKEAAQNWLKKHGRDLFGVV